MSGRRPRSNTDPEDPWKRTVPSHSLGLHDCDVGVPGRILLMSSLGTPGAGMEVNMGLFKMWKQAKAVAASGVPGGQTQRAPQGMLSGFAAVMMKMMGPTMAAQAPERGDPLP